MRSAVSTLAVIVPPEETIDRVIRRMAAESRAVAHAGLAVVLDSAGYVLGVLTDGDIRRAYARGVSWGSPVSSIMIKQPITLPIGINPDEIILELSRRVEKAPHLKAKTIRHILLVDKSNRLVGIHDFMELLWDRDEKSARVHVIGMGFVGLTLAIGLANVGHRVTGVDIDEKLIRKLQQGESVIYESGLAAKLKHVLEREVLSFDTSLEESRSSIYIVAVGTPVKDGKQASLSDLRDVSEDLSRVLKAGDQVMLRSTVAVGTTREILLPILEKGSGLRVAENFNLVFAPERTLAGKALSELQTLPQIVGGVTPRCTERAARFWSSLTHTVVRLPSPEAAELAKLANNSFRNVSFAFANELADLASEYNLNADEIIQAANKGYPRNPIPLASPGVGGYCLPKDSILLASSFSRSMDAPRLSIVANNVNERAGLYPIEVINQFCANADIPITSISVLVIGVAFKGEPETNDLRGSIGVAVAQILSEKGVEVVAWDAVVNTDEIVAAGLQPAVNREEAVSQSDVVLVMNNHRNNADIDITALGRKSSPKLVFDGWGLLDRKDTESIKGVYYSAPGYLTPF